jgi:hypothetical protein
LLASLYTRLHALYGSATGEPKSEVVEPHQLRHRSSSGIFFHGEFGGYYFCVSVIALEPRRRIGSAGER